MRGARACAPSYAWYPVLDRTLKASRGFWVRPTDQLTSNRRRCALAAICIALLATSLWSPASASAAPLLGVVGNTYTSSNFGFSWSWDNDWSFDDQTIEEGF